MDEQVTLTDEEIETRPLATAPGSSAMTADTGDDTGDVSDTSDTGDDSRDVSDTEDTGDDSGDDARLPDAFELTLSPIAEAAFLDEYCKRRPLAVERGAPGRFDSILSASSAAVPS